MRAVFGASGGGALIYASANMLIVDATAIGLLYVVFVIPLGVVVLKERLKGQHLGAIAICCAGAVLIMASRGAFTAFHLAYVFPAGIAVIGAALLAVEGLMIKMLSSSDRAMTVLLYVNTFGILLMAGPAAMQWVPLSFETATSLVLSRLKFLVAFRPGLISPALVAHQAATFQRMTGGRLLLNVVTGGDRFEQARFGDHLDQDARYERTEEFLSVVRGVTSASAGQPFSFTGKHFDIREASIDPAPYGLPQIFFGGGARPLWRWLPDRPTSIWFGVARRNSRQRISRSLKRVPLQRAARYASACACMSFHATRRMKPGPWPTNY